MAEPEMRALMLGQWCCLRCRRIFGWAFPRCGYCPVVIPIEPGSRLEDLFATFPELF